MEHEKQYNLLRPFNKEQALEGKPICDRIGELVQYVAGPDADDDVCVWYDQEQLCLESQRELRMAPITWVEGQPVVEGETLYHKSIAVQGVVVRWCNNTVMLDTGRGTVSFFPTVLTRTDPTILFEVEGKPVRKGDKLFSTNAYHYGGERTIAEVNERGVYATTDCGHKGSINSLTWEAPTLVEIEGVCVHTGDSVWHRDTGNPWEVVSFNKLHKTLFCKNMQGCHISFKADQVSTKPPLFHLKGKAIFAGDKVWTLGGDEVHILDMDQQGVVITTESGWSGCTRFDVEGLSATPVARLVVDGVEVKKGDKLFDKVTGKPVIVYRQVWDKVEQSSGGSWTADMLTRTDPTPLFHLDGKPVREGDTVYWVSPCGSSSYGEVKAFSPVADVKFATPTTEDKVLVHPPDVPGQWVLLSKCSLKPYIQLSDKTKVEVGGTVYFEGKPYKVKSFAWPNVTTEDGTVLIHHLLTGQPQMVEVPIWVNCYDDGSIGRARLSCGNYPLVGSLLQEVEGTLKVPKHIADKLKR